MIYDYSLLTSFLFTSLFIFVSVYTIYHARNRINIKSNVKKSEEQVISKQITFDLNLLYTLLAFLIVIRLFFLFIFPIELQKASLSDSIFSLRFGFVIFQGIAVSHYIFFFIRLKLLKQISDKDKANQTLKLLYRGLGLSISEVILSFIGYAYLSYNQILPEISALHFKSFDPLESYFILYLSILTVTFLILFFFSYLILQKKKNLFNISIFVALQFITLIIAVLLTIKQLPFFFSGNFLKVSAMQLLSYSTGFIGWIWFFILLIGIGSQIFNITIIRMRKQFANQQIAVNYSMQLVKICILSLTIISIVSILPVLFSILTYIQR